MQVSKINFESICTSTKQGLKGLGERTIDFIKDAKPHLETANNRFDTFIKNNFENANPKEIKQIGVGIAVCLAGAKLITSCIKGIVNSIKEKVEEK